MKDFIRILYFFDKQGNQYTRGVFPHTCIIFLLWVTLELIPDHWQFFFLIFNVEHVKYNLKKLDTISIKRNVYFLSAMTKVKQGNEHVGTSISQ